MRVVKPVARFDSLSIGECFEHDGSTYMKVEWQDNPFAVHLNMGVIVIVDMDTMVVPLDAKMSINGFNPSYVFPENTTEPKTQQQHTDLQQLLGFRSQNANKVILR